MGATFPWFSGLRGLMIPWARLAGVLSPGRFNHARQARGESPDKVHPVRVWILFWFCDLYLVLKSGLCLVCGFK